MREIVLDTETTGFEPNDGDRIVEIGALELFNHVPTGRTYHQYINPERYMPNEAFGVHGIGPDLLSPPRKAEPGEVTRGQTGVCPNRSGICGFRWGRQTCYSQRFV